MRHSGNWSPSKYGFQNGRLSHSLDRRELAPSSRLFASLIADFYNRTIPAFASGSLLDLGCGKQPLFGIYRSRVATVTAVDWPSSLHTSDHIDVYCDLSKPLPFHDESFDTILSSDVLEHLPNPDLMFREAGRTLRPGGVLLLNTPFLYPVHEAPHDFLRHTRYSLERLAKSAGFDLVTVESLGGFLEVVIDMVSKVLVHTPVVGPGLVGILQGLAIRTQDSVLFRKSRALTSAYFTLGHGLVAQKPTR